MLSLSIPGYGFGQAFVTTWKTDNPGTSADNQVTIPTVGGGYNYSVDWGDGNTDVGLFGGITHTYATPGTYTVSITGDFPRMYFNGGRDAKKLLTIESWGSIAWTDMTRAFNGCSHLVVNATDAPNLTGVQSMQSMFSRATALTGNFSNWDVSQITNMHSAFSDCTNFNGDLSSWDVSKVALMTNLFENATSFNSDLSSWNTGNVESMEGMFEGATAFNQDLSNWNVARVKNFRAMFKFASVFNADLSTWDVDSSTTFLGMFQNASNFASDLSGWDVSQATNMLFMFSNASAFDSDLSGWDVGLVTNMNNMLVGSALTLENYDRILAGWAALPSLQPNVFLGASSKFSCAGNAAKQVLIDTYGWTVLDAGTNCDGAFISTWNTTLLSPTSSSDHTLSLPLATGVDYHFTVDWGDGTSSLVTQASASHTYATPGVYELKITGDIPRLHFNNGGDRVKITDISQWGVQAWTTFERAFWGCDGLDISAIDAPNLANVSSMEGAFRGASSLTASFLNWDVSGVNNFTDMFRDATSFNGNISGWDVSGASQFGNMFQGATSFNQPLNAWDMGSALGLASMFEGATSFNQDLNSWDFGTAVGAVAMFKNATAFNGNISSWDVGFFNNFRDMFQGATAFNQDISGWNMVRASNLSGMFQNATSFDQDLGTWNISKVSNLEDALSQSGMSLQNYDRTLTGWAMRETLESNVTLGALGLQHCIGAMAIDSLVAKHQWTIVDDGRPANCPGFFVTTWKTDNLGSTGSNQIHIPTAGPGNGYSYSVSWGDGTFDYDLTDDVTHTYAQAGNYTVAITGDFPALYFNYRSLDNEKLLSVDRWGGIAWQSMESAFYRCANLTIDATDAPDLSQVSSLQGMFQDIPNFQADLGHWDVSAVSNFTAMFMGDTLFNADLSAWDVGSATSLNAMFKNAKAFNQPLTSWNVSAVSDMQGMFQYAVAFNQDISGWNTGAMQDASQMFEGAIAFDQDLSGWDYVDVTDLANFLDNSAVSPLHYDLLLAALMDAPINSPITVGAAGIHYCLGAEARNQLISRGWTIQDAGEDCQPLFVTTWKTDNPGTTEDHQIRIPTEGDGYNYTIAWGDGLIETGVTGSITHDYDVPGSYTVRITGEFPRIYMYQSGGEDKILTIEEWGDNPWTTMERAFQDCSQLTVPATDAPKLASANSLASMFNGCTILTGDLSGWDVSSIVHFQGMFSDATLFNSDLSAWDVANATNMGGMFRNAEAFTSDLRAWDISGVGNFYETFAGAKAFQSDLSEWDISAATQLRRVFFNATSFDSDLSGWDFVGVGLMDDMLTGSGTSDFHYDQLLVSLANQTGLSGSVDFGAADKYYCLGETARNYLVSTLNWTISDAGKAATCGAPFVTSWNTEQPGASPNDAISIPTRGAGYDYQVDWGDGNLEEGLSGDASHSYAVPGDYTVRIYGAFPSIHLNQTGDAEKIQSIDQWGDIAWQSMEKAFAGCTHLELAATDAPDLTGVSSMVGMFQEADSLTASLNHWDVSQVLQMDSLFLGTEKFNGVLSDWDVSQVTSMVSMFQGAKTFSQDLLWNTTSLSALTRVFQGAENFNGDISGWDVSGVNDFAYLLEGATQFNGNLSNWNVTQGTHFTHAFSGATAFNQDLGAWELANATLLEGMLDGTALSVQNYRSTLTGWQSPEKTLPSGLTLGATGLEYCLGDTSRSRLANDLGWMILGDNAKTCASGTDILSFSMTEQSSEAIINATAHSVELVVQEGTSLGALLAQIGLSDQAIVSPDTGQLLDYSLPVSYVVTAEDGTQQAWEATVLERQLQTLNIEAPTEATYGDSPLPVTISTSSGLPVNFSLGDGSALVNYADDSLQILGVGTVTLQANQAGNRYFAPAAEVEQLLEIGKATLTVTPVDQEKTYGDVNPALSLGYSGFVKGESVDALTAEPSLSNTATPQSHTGTYPITLSGGAADNYAFHFVEGTLTVSKADLQVEVPSVSRQYGTELPSVAFTYTGFLNEDNATDLDVAPSLSSEAVASSDVGTYSLQSVGGEDNNYRYVHGTNDLTISPAPLLVIANPTLTTYGIAPSTFTFTYEGFENGEDETELSALPTANTQAVSTSPVGDYAIVPSGGAATNYSLSYEEGILTVGPATLTVLPTAAGRAYGEENPVLAYTLTGFVNGEDEAMLSEVPSLATTAIPVSPVSEYPITAMGGAAPNYQLEYEMGTLTVSPATLTVSVNSAAREYGDENPPLEFTLSGFANGEDETILSEVPSLATIATPASSVGEYAITAMEGAAPNYQFEYEEGTLTVQPATLTVGVQNATKVYNEALPDFQLSYGGFKNAEDATVLTEVPTVATAASATSDVGTYTLVPQGGSALNYVMVYTEGQLTISQAVATILLGQLTQFADGSPKMPEVLTSPTGLMVRLTYDGASTPPTEEGQYMLVASIDELNYRGDTTAIFTLEANPLGLKVDLPWVVYPNPTTDVVRIDTEEVLHLEVFDVYGRSTLITGRNQVDLHTMPTGAYFLQVKNRAGQLLGLVPISKK
ncbi:MAG: BspA family leucine-rich repeat surface protein [Bacteroidota bacterium]